MTRAIEVLAWSLAFIAAVIVYIATAIVAWPIKWTGRGLSWLLRWSVATMSRACAVFDGDGLRPPEVEVWRGFDYGVGQGPPPADRISDEATPWPTKREMELCRAMRNAPRSGLAGLGDAMMQQGPPLSGMVEFRRYGDSPGPQDPRQAEEMRRIVRAEIDYVANCGIGKGPFVEEIRRRYGEAANAEDVPVSFAKYSDIRFGELRIPHPGRLDPLEAANADDPAEKERIRQLLDGEWTRTAEASGSPADDERPAG